MNNSLLIKILADKADTQEIKQFESWLQQKPENKVYFSKLKTLWTCLGGIYDKAEFDKAAARLKIQTKIQGRKTKARVMSARILIAVAASILLLIGLGYLNFSKSFMKNSDLITYSAKDTIREIKLPDGSHIWLNDKSSLKAPIKFSKSHRKVFLQGEAYFEIAQDKSKSFKVQTGKIITEVLGTSFNIKMSDTDHNITLIVKTGKVAFYKRNSLKKKSLLFPGDKGKYLATNDKILVTENTNQNYLAWKTGILTFYDATLKQVCEDLSRFYKIEVESSNEVSSYRLTGTFKNEDLLDVIQTIELTLDVKIKEIDKKLIFQN